MITFLPKQADLENLYNKLIIMTNEYRCSERNKDKDYVLFGAIAGRNYCQNGLMVIGRSPNGWHRYDLSSNGLFKGNSRIFDYPEKLSELKENNKSSKLWRILNLICSNLYGSNWEQHIFYSNFYKLAPDEYAEPNGTPTITLRNLQQEICNRILCLELETYRPKNIIVFTGCYKGTEFSERIIPTLLTYFLGVDYSNREWPQPINRILWGNDKYALEVYSINGVYIYLTEHPDRKSCNTHANILLTEVKKHI